MNSELIARIHQELAADLTEKGFASSGRSANYFKVNNAVLYVAKTKFDKVVSNEGLAELVAQDFLVEDGRAIRISWGTKQKLVVGVKWAKLETFGKKHSVELAQVTILKNKVKDLERDLKDALDTSASNVAWVNLLDTIEKSYAKARPKASSIIIPERKVKGVTCEGVATLVLSDWHWGESVEKAQVNGLNEYNLDIASKRANRIFNTALKLLNPTPGKYEALVVPILGDMLSGIIHEELLLTNDASLIECILSLVAKLEEGLFALAQQFPKVHVSCVYGNHGRMDRRKTHKRQSAMNYETLVYRILQQNLRLRMGDRCNITFQIGDSSDVITSIYNNKFLLTHGDQFEDFDGSPLDKVRRGDSLKRRRSQETHQAIHDYLICGHFHNYGSFGNIIMNGSLVGYNEFAFNKHLSIERPQQALFVTHPEHGIIRQMPVFADDPIIAYKSSKPVSIST